MIEPSAFKTVCREFENRHVGAVILRPTSESDPLYAPLKSWLESETFLRTSVERWMVHVTLEHAPVLRSHARGTEFVSWFLDHAQLADYDLLTHAIPRFFSEEYSFLDASLVQKAGNSFGRLYSAMVKNNVGLLHPLRFLFGPKLSDVGTQEFRKVFGLGLEAMRLTPNHKDAILAAGMARGNWDLVDQQEKIPVSTKLAMMEVCRSLFEDTPSITVSADGDSGTRLELADGFLSDPKNAITDSRHRLALERLQRMIQLERRCRALDPEKDWRKLVTNVRSNIDDLQSTLVYAKTADSLPAISLATDKDALEALLAKLHSVQALSERERLRELRQAYRNDRIRPQDAQSRLEQRCRQITDVFNGLYDMEENPSGLLRDATLNVHRIIFSGFSDVRLLQLPNELGEHHVLEHGKYWLDLDGDEDKKGTEDLIASANLLIWHQLCHAVDTEMVESLIVSVEKPASISDALEFHARETVYDALAMGMGCLFYAHPEPGTSLAVSSKQRRGIMLKSLRAFSRRVERACKKGSAPRAMLARVKAELKANHLPARFLGETKDPAADQGQEIEYLCRLYAKTTEIPLASIYL